MRGKYNLNSNKMSSNVSEKPGSRKTGQLPDTSGPISRGMSPSQAQRSSSLVGSMGGRRIREASEGIQYQNISSRQHELMPMNLEGKESYLSYL